MEAGITSTPGIIDGTMKSEVILHETRSGASPEQPYFQPGPLNSHGSGTLSEMPADRNRWPEYADLRTEAEDEPEKHGIMKR